MRVCQLGTQGIVSLGLLFCATYPANKISSHAKSDAAKRRSLLHIHLAHDAANGHAAHRKILCPLHIAQGGDTADEKTKRAKLSASLTYTPDNRVNHGASLNLVREGSALQQITASQRAHCAEQTDPATDYSRRANIEK